MREVKPQKHHTRFSRILIFGRVWRKGGAYNVGTGLASVPLRAEGSVALATCVRTVRFVRRVP